MERVGEPGATEINEIAPELPTGNDLFQGASADGTKVYFTTARDIPGTADLDTGAQCSATPGISAGCDLYLYDSTKPEGSRITMVSTGPTGPTPGEGAEVLSSITAVSGDGSRAYFVAQGVLTTDANPVGATAIAEQPNLYSYESTGGTTEFIGTLAAGDQGAMWGTEGSFTGDAYSVPFYGTGPGGDGHVLVFASEAPLTGVLDDEDGGARDVFRYDADAGTLIRISTAADGGEDAGPFDVAVNANSANARGANLEEQGRFASEDGETIAFNTASALAPGDEDAEEDPYVWKAGELGTVNAVVDADDLPTVSPDGGEIAFATTSRLLPQDRDAVKDVYVAKVDGGFPLPPPPPVPCDPLLEDDCPGPSVPSLPSVPRASSATTGAGNVKEAVKCKKGFVKKKGRCVKKKSRKGKKHRKGSAKGRGSR